ncbi:MAG: SDR family NAD(P)-dependent oxidoreductase [Planctomycetes bacterium]|nr:SDR family NAD(P)-dependent oxidoreductase [Planctomycetota bacterium]MDA0947016.1 SDR family NAD(P)-dependent oxidoreductase [Planctomycetota bacterium]
MDLEDLLVWRSFDRRGYERHARRATGADVPVSLAGRRVLVTGATQGIGHALAQGLARRGADLELWCRDPARAERLRDELLAAGAAAVGLCIADLGDLDAVRREASRTGDAPLDAVLHNAGLLPLERARTPQGFEVTYGVHLLGPLVLTEALLPRLRARAARVVWMTSGGAYTQRLHPGVLRDGVETRDRYDGVRSYAQTKRGQIVVADALHRLLAPGVSAFSVHPGWVDTRAVRESLPGFHRRMGPHLRTPEQGADGALWLSTAALGEQALARGGMWFDRRPVGQHPLPWTRPGRRTLQAFLQQCVEDAGLGAGPLAGLAGVV